MLIVEYLAFAHSSVPDHHAIFIMNSILHLALVVPDASSGTIVPTGKSSGRANCDTLLHNCDTLHNARHTRARHNCDRDSGDCQNPRPSNSQLAGQRTHDVKAVNENE